MITNFYIKLLYKGKRRNKKCRNKMMVSWAGIIAMEQGGGWLFHAFMHDLSYLMKNHDRQDAVS